jgi:16S rRNA (cytosine967-C5)-methyltransferase
MPNTRFLAVKSLSGILDRGSRPKHLIDSLSAQLDRRDRSFLMEMVYGCLRHRDTLDWIMDHFLKKPSKLGSFTRNNLRTALYQIFFMRVPHRAVVHEAVDLENKFSPRGGAGKAPLVNAVLRNVLRRNEEFTPPFSLSDPEASIALNTSHPKWLVRRWIERWGIEEACRIAAANNQIPSLTLRANTLRKGREELIGLLKEQGIGCNPTLYSPDGIITGARTYEDLSFARGSLRFRTRPPSLSPVFWPPGQASASSMPARPPGARPLTLHSSLGTQGRSSLSKRTLTASQR